MAHMLIGFYTIADTDEGILKVMRSYQYYAAVGIANIVAEKKLLKNTAESGRSIRIW